MIRLLCVVALLWLGSGVMATAGARAGAEAAIRGQVTVADSAPAAGTGGGSEREALIVAIKESWTRYLHQDAAGYTATLTDDVTRMSQRFNRIQQGRAAVAAGLPAEWLAFERPGGVIAEDMTIDQVELTVDPDGTAATALYVIDVTGGARWRYSDRALVFQALVREGGGWRIAHQTDAWALTDGQQNRSRVFEFEYVYPVDNLARALAFYRPILGEPEAETADRAVFNLTGPRFVLDAGTLHRLGRVRPGLPSGYAAFLVPDVAAERDRLAAAGVTFLAGTATTLKSRDGDRYAIGTDISGNVFVLLQKVHLTAGTGPAPQIGGFTGTSPYIEAARRVAGSWMSLDAEQLARWYGTAGRWFDNTRVNDQGMHQGANAIAASLRTIYWPRYDRSAGGITGRLDVSRVRVRRVGARTIVGYAMTQTGTGPHPYRDTSFVTHLFEGPERIANTFIVNNNRPSAMALDLDYTGYPVNSLAESERFYTRVMRLGQPYTDDNWRGYWSNYTVFGIYATDVAEDGIPVVNQGNGYVSFWVRSARQAYDYLRQQGSHFPVIPSINAVSGIESAPGYTQVTATDSEGSVVVFTEYSGRPR